MGKTLDEVERLLAATLKRAQDAIDEGKLDAGAKKPGSSSANASLVWRLR